MRVKKKKKKKKAFSSQYLYYIFKVYPESINIEVVFTKTDMINA